MTTRAQMEGRRQRARLLGETWLGHFKGHPLKDSDVQMIALMLGQYSDDEVLVAIRIAAEQYGVFNPDGTATATSANFALSKLKGICFIRARQRTNPGEAELYHISAIARSNCGYFAAWEALAMLKEAFNSGTSLEKLMDIAKATRSWSHFKDLMRAL